MMCNEQHDAMISVLVKLENLETGFPRILESPEFFPVFSRPWKVLENQFGPGKSWK